MTVRVENSTPMVVRLSWLNSLRVNRDRRLVLPTPDSPISTTEGVERGGLSQGTAARSLPELDGLSHLNEELRSEKQEKSCLFWQSLGLAALHRISVWGRGTEGPGVLEARSTKAAG